MASANEKLAVQTRGAIGHAEAEAREDALVHEDEDITRLVLDVATKGIKGINVAESVTAGRIVRTINGASTVEITIHDQARQLINAKNLHKDGRLRAIDIRLDGLWFRLVKISKNGDDLTLTFEDREVTWLRGKKGPRKASRAKVTRAQFILSLVRSVKTKKIPVDIPNLRKKRPVGAETKVEKKQTTDKGLGNRELQGKNGPINIEHAERVLTEADKNNAGDKAMLALIMACIIEAPDFANPIDGEGTSVGILQLTDDHYGGNTSVNGGRRDIEKVVQQFLLTGFTGAGGAIELARKHPEWTAGNVAQAVQGSGHPERYDTVRGQAKTILDAWGGAGGGGTGGAAYYKKYEFKVNGPDPDTRTEAETYWEAIQRLAKEVEYRAFMSAGKFTYRSENSLYTQTPKFKITEFAPGVNYIDFDWDHGKKAATARVGVRVGRWAVPPGITVELDGVGAANGKWLVESSSRDLFSPVGELTLKKPMETLPEPRPQRMTRSADGDSETENDSVLLGGSNGDITSKTAIGIVTQAVAIAQEFGDKVYVVSDYRPGDPLDHGGNNDTMAARDIAVKGVNALTGPPQPELDKAIVAIGKALGRDYASGKTGPFQSADNVSFNGFRVQLIWRTPRWGGHMGHIHIGARKEGAGHTPGQG